jgi:hypothetical protein
MSRLYGRVFMNETPLNSDTPLDIEKRMIGMIASKSPAERLRMASGMFDAGKKLVIAGLLMENSRLSEAQLRGRLLVRMYGDGFSREKLKTIAAGMPRMQLD